MSESDVATRLHDLLRADPPPAVQALSETDRATLADLIADARKRQDDSLVESFDRTLKHVPFPVRKIVKKVLMG